MKICHCQTQICAGGIKKKKIRKKKVGRKHKTSRPTDGMPNYALLRQVYFPADPRIYIIQEASSTVIDKWRLTPQICKSICLVTLPMLALLWAYQGLYIYHVPYFVT